MKNKYCDRQDITLDWQQIIYINCKGIYQNHTVNLRLFLNFNWYIAKTKNFFFTALLCNFSCCTKCHFFNSLILNGNEIITYFILISVPIQMKLFSSGIEVKSFIMTVMNWIIFFQQFRKFYRCFIASTTYVSVSTQPKNW